MNIKYLLLFVFISFNISAQVVPFGLNGIKVTSIALTKGISEKTVIAGTEANGIYFHILSEQDSTWIQHYFFDRTISSVYVQGQGVGPADFSGIFAAIVPDSADSTLIYFNNYPVQSFWAVKDSGLDKSEVRKIVSFAGFDYLGHAQPLPVFASSNDSVIYILKNDVWEKSWIGPENTIINTLYSNESTIFGGGIIQGAFATLFLVSSKDYGENWNLIYPPFGEIFSCYSIVSPPGDSLTIYAGLNELVIKSIDGGNSWTLLLSEDNIIFNSLVINPLNPDIIFAGGKTSDNLFVLYKSSNEGSDWEPIVPVINCCVKGINNIASITTNEYFTLYIATDGSGVFKYSENIVYVPWESQELPEQFRLEQNFPNPFNPNTRIQYAVSQRQFVTLKVYDILGREIATLVNEEKRLGTYSVNFDASNLASGIYFYKLTSGNFSQTKKMVLAK